MNLFGQRSKTVGITQNFLVVITFYFAMNEVCRESAPFEVQYFYKVIQIFFETPTHFFKRIAFVEITPVSEENNVKVFHRKFFSKVPEKDPSITDVVTFDYNTNVVTFQPIIPDDAVVFDFIPFYYPKVRKFSYSYEMVDDSPFLFIRASHDNPEYDPILKSFSSANAKKFVKWAKREATQGYKKRVHHDILVPLQEYYDIYQAMKIKYRHWVDFWPESTDPKKFVFEEMAIAAFLICLLKREREITGLTKMQSFVDVGCGNGFLVFLLTNEGHPGRGIDISARGIWSEYEKYGKKPELVVGTLYPDKDVFDDVDWIIGNHSDELTPWIPFMCSKSPNTRFFVLPCCMWDFQGRYTKNIKELGRYGTYLQYIEFITAELGFRVETEVLRIPSTKNKAIIGRIREYDVHSAEDQEAIDVKRKELLVNFNGTFVPRKTDRENTDIYKKKVSDKKKKREAAQRKEQVIPPNKQEEEEESIVELVSDLSIVE